MSAANVAARFLKTISDEELQADKRRKLEVLAIKGESDEACPAYSDTSGRFRVAKRTYTQQYSQIYFCRLQHLKPALREKALSSWPNALIVDSIKHLPIMIGDEGAVIMGIIYKDMKLKPSALDAYLKELDLQAPTQSYLSDTDRLYLEDEVVRVRLKSRDNADGRPTLDHGVFVTGVAIACLGRRLPSGDFEVQDYRFAGPLCSPYPIASTTSDRIAFVSDLRIGNDDTKYRSLLMLRDYLTSVENSVGASPPARRLVMLGSTITSFTSSSSLPKSDASATYPVRALEEADAFLVQMAAALPLDVVPGPLDPTNLSLPQHPIHPAIFPRNRLLKSFSSKTNPYSFTFNQINFVVMSSQSVEDVLRFSAISRPIDALQMLVESSNLCPTAPDTLPCYPFTDTDPFCLHDLRPHVVISGGHECLENVEIRRWKEGQWLDEEKTTESAEQVQMVIAALPSFYKSGIMLMMQGMTIDVIRLRG